MIIIRPRGRLANKMFQLMFALELRDRTRRMTPVVGVDIPEWNLVSAPFQRPGGLGLTLTRHIPDIDKVAYLLRANLLGSVVVDGWGMRLEYYKPPSHYYPLFKRRVPPPHQLRDTDLLIHIRLGDIQDGHHRRYYPLPFSFYERIIGETGLRPVFMGELEPSPYADALRQRFRGAVFLPKSSVLEDFELVRSARHVVLSISSFGWLASWLSETAASIHLPVSGLFDPRNGETMLLPLGDSRYRFYDLPFPSLEARSDIDLVPWAKGTQEVSVLDDTQLTRIVLGAGSAALDRK